MNNTLILAILGAVAIVVLVVALIETRKHRIALATAIGVIKSAALDVASAKLTLVAATGVASVAAAAAANAVKQDALATTIDVKKDVAALRVAVSTHMEGLNGAIGDVHAKLDAIKATVSTAPAKV